MKYEIFSEFRTFGGTKGTNRYINAVEPSVKDRTLTFYYAVTLGEWDVDKTKFLDNRTRRARKVL